MTAASSRRVEDHTYIVRSPRATDGIGQALRGVFGKPSVPDDLAQLLRKLDRVPQ